MQSMRATIAAGHTATVEAGLEILGEGGSAADAAIAACVASCVAETVMTGMSISGSMSLGMLRTLRTPMITISSDFEDPVT
jgi:hypothetical protein